MVHEKELLVSDEDFYLSLAKMLAVDGRSIIDIHGYISREFGDPCFKMVRLSLDDGTFLYLNGEHDIAYIEDEPRKIPILSKTELDRLEKEDE